ncbi:MAG TPA: flagellar protein FlaG [Gammaproteobacteria bacterium]|nr:flagellar protein FlaG [Gammaproteobacteria bacterium]
MNIANLNTPPSAVVNASTAKTPVAAKGEVVAPTFTSGKVLPETGQKMAAGQDVASGDVQQAGNKVSLEPTEVRDLAEQANAVLEQHSSDLKFTVAEGTDIPVIRIEDKKTGELIRQIPSEAMVAIARALEETQRGAVVKEEV